MATLNNMISTWMAPAPIKLKLYWLRKFGVIVPRALETRILDIWASFHYRTQPVFDGANNVIRCGTREYALTAPRWHTLPVCVVVKIGVYLKGCYFAKGVPRAATLNIAPEQYNAELGQWEWLTIFGLKNRVQRLPVIHQLLRAVKNNYRELMLRDRWWFSPDPLRSRQVVQDAMTVCSRYHRRKWKISDHQMTILQRTRNLSDFKPEYIPACLYPLEHPPHYMGHLFRIRVKIRNHNTCHDLYTRIDVDQPVTNRQLLRANFDLPRGTEWNKHVLICGTKRFTPRTAGQPGTLYTRAPRYWPHAGFYAGNFNMNKKLMELTFTGRAKFQRV